MSQFVPGSWALSIYLILCDKLCLYSRNFLVLITFVFARTLSFQFKTLFQNARNMLYDGTHYISDPARWKLLVADHVTLYEIFLRVEEFLSPIIFLVYGVNVYCICTEVSVCCLDWASCSFCRALFTSLMLLSFILQLSSVLLPTDGASLADRVHCIWALLHVSACIYMVSVSGAGVSHWAHKVTELYKKCPQDSYSIEVKNVRFFLVQMG